MFRCTSVAVTVWLCCLCCAQAIASTVVFFDNTQVATIVESGVNSDTVSSNGYLFTYTRDKLFTGGTGHIIGRQVRVPWPQGVEAQAVTTPPPGVTDYKARITLARVDGDVFNLTSFTARLLANTAGAGGSIEIMPLLDGEDAFNDPLYFDASGYSGNEFSYDESPDPWGSTALLKGFDTYKIGLYVDFAFTALSLEGAPVPRPIGDYNGNGIVDAADYTVWRDTLGQHDVGLAADGNGDNMITPADYDIWKTRFGQSAGSGSAALSADAAPELNFGAGGSACTHISTEGYLVPEPTIAVFILVGMLTACQGRLVCTIALIPVPRRVPSS